jgi:hypothetical protein
MLLTGKTQRHQLRQSEGLDLPGAIGKMNQKISAAEFCHHLAANTAGAAQIGDFAAHTTANGDGGKFPMAVIYRLEEGSALSAIGGGIGGIFDVAALINAAVSA